MSFGGHSKASSTRQGKKKQGKNGMIKSFTGSLKYNLPQETVYWAEASYSSDRQQFSETDSYVVLLIGDSQRNFSTFTLFTICLAVTWTTNSSHQPKSPFVLIAFMRTRCSWVSLDLNHTDTAGNNLIRHKQVSSPLKQPFILWPTGMFGYLKIFNWMVSLFL